MKKIISFLASILVAVSMMTGLSGEVVQTLMTVKSYAANNYEGKCGENATYKFDNSTGILTVSGTGSIYDNYTAGSETNATYEAQSAPWKEWKNLIRSIDIKSGITHIGEFAFEKCENLKSVKIGTGVRDIGRDAFAGCSSLSNVEFSNLIKEIGGWAFMDCTSLEKINLPSNIEIIDRDAFFNTGIRDLVIPDTVKEIYRDAFACCDNLKSVKFPKHMEALNRGLVASCKNLTKVVFPENVKSLGRELFNGCTSLTSIAIPSTVTEIAFSAFEGCTNLNHIELPNSVNYIGEAAFNNSGYYNNKNNWKNGALYLGDCLIGINSSVTGDFSVKDGTRVIASKAFYESSVKNVTVPASVKHIGIIPFSNCSNLNSVYFLGKELEFVSESFIDKEVSYTVYCVKNSDVYKYVTENSIKYALIDESVKNEKDTPSSGEKSAVDLATKSETEAVGTVVQTDTDIPSDQIDVDSANNIDGSSEKKADNVKKSNKTVYIVVAAGVAVAAVVTVIIVLKKRCKTVK